MFNTFSSAIRVSFIKFLKIIRKINQVTKIVNILVSPELWKLFWNRDEYFPKTTLFLVFSLVEQKQNTNKKNSMFEKKVARRLPENRRERGF